MIQSFATSTVPLLNQDIFMMYLVAPILALILFCSVVLIRNYSW